MTLFSSCYTILRNSVVSSSRFLQLRVAPFLHKSAERFFLRITREPGSTYWSAIQPSKKWNVLIIRSLVSFSGITIVWASVTSVDESVQALGKLEPMGSTLPVRAPIGGVVKKILVSEGDYVELGQRIIEMDTTAATARLYALREVRDKVTADILVTSSQLGHEIDESLLSPNQVRRLNSLKIEFDSRISAYRNSIQQSKYQLRSLQSDLLYQEKSLSLREKTLSQIRPLVEIGALSRIQLAKELGEVEILRGRVQSLRSDVSRQNEVILEAQNKLKNTLSLSEVDFSTKLDESQKQLAQLNNQISEAQVTLDYQNLVSPANGIVFDMRPSSPGFVVTGEEPLLKIVPTDYLVARAYVTNKDIGFIRTGQPVKVRVDAYPYNEFGQLSGFVKSIGSDVLEPDQNFNFYRFPVTITFDADSLDSKSDKLPLLSGMSISANIVLRQRPVISLFAERILPFWNSLERL